MKNEIFNLRNQYGISVVDDNKIHWTMAEEWSPWEAGFEETDPDTMYTDYSHGDGEIIEDILVLNRPSLIIDKENCACDFHEKLKAIPEWTATDYFVTSLYKKFPDIRNCHTGQHVSFRESIYVMLKLGFTWDPDTDRFERADLEEESTLRISRIKAMLNRSNSKISNTDNKETVN